MYRYLSLQKICILIIHSVFFRSMDFLIDLKIFYKCSKKVQKHKDKFWRRNTLFCVLHSVNLDKNRTRRRIGEGDFSVSPKRKNTVFLLIWWQKASKFSACGGPVFFFKKKRFLRIIKNIILILESGIFPQIRGWISCRTRKFITPP